MPTKAKPSAVAAAPIAAAPSSDQHVHTTLPIPDLHLDFEAFVDGLGLRFFRGREFTEYWSRWKNGVRNECPPEGIWHRIVPTLLVLDRVRLVADVPLIITSSYRSPRYNRAVGGEPNSFHMRFMAIDFYSNQANARQLHEVARSMRRQVFAMPGNEGNFRWEGGIGLYSRSNFVHIDCRQTPADWQGN